MTRYLRLLRVQLRNSLVLAMQYRAEFVVQGLMALFWMAWGLLPVVVVYGSRTQIAGWSYEEALVVVGWFTVMKAILEGAVSPSLQSVVEHIRKGTLDFVLVKPADAQFLVSTTRFEPWRAIDLLGGAAIFAWAFSKLGRWPSLPHVAGALALLFAGVVVLYSLWILVISLAFYVVKVDNLSFFFESVFDAARWPASVFRGVVRVIFTFVIPLAIMTTYPALALLGRLEMGAGVAVLLGALLFGTLARMVWLGAIGRYTSASS
jgi:ABC-2 type transport system permease protein